MKTFTFTKACKDWNEDRCFACENFAFVLDGESSLTKQVFSKYSSDTEWYTEWWKSFLKENLGDLKRTIPSILKEGLRLVTAEYKKLSGNEKIIDHPSCMAAVVRRNKGNLEVFVLGDCPILVQTKTGMVFEISDTLNNVNDNVNKMIIKDFAVKNNLSVVEARKAFPDCITNGRLRKNTAGHYFVLAEKQVAISHSVQTKFRESLVSKILIMSDGFSQLYDLFHLFGKEKLLEKLSTRDDIEEAYSLLCIAQNKDEKCDNFVRFKVRDDSSAVLMNFAD